EDTLWAGGPYSPANPEVREHLDEVRRLIFDGRYAEAERLADRHLMARPLKQMPYQPAGDVIVAQESVGQATGYRRSLDLDSAVQTTTFTAGGIAFTREVFASAADGIIVCRFLADRAGAVTLRVELGSEQNGS